MYSAAKLAALEGTLIKDDFLVALCGASYPDEFQSRLREDGITPRYAAGAFDAELTLTSYLSEKYELLAGFIPDPEPRLILQARYDFHNIKTAVKCRLLGIDPSPYFIDCGTVPPDKIAGMAKSRDWSELPDGMREAATAADKETTGSARPRQADVILDSACFSYMKKLADGFGCRPVSRLLSLKSDLTNLVTRLRIFRISNKPAVERFLKDSFVAGGKVSLKKLASCAGPEEVFGLYADILTPGELAALSYSSSQGSDPGAASAACDRVFLSRAEECGRTSQLGIYPLIRFLTRTEYGVKNLRLICAGLESGKSAEALREELIILV